MRRAFWPLTAVAALLVGLATIGTLQYRWIGEVSDAERDRMRASLRTRTGEFTQEFDGELTNIYVAFQVDPKALGTDPDRALAEAWGRFQSSALVPAVVRDVYLLEARAGGAMSLRRFNPTIKALDAGEGPSDIEGWRGRTELSLRSLPGLPPMLLADAVDDTLPGLVISFPDVPRPAPDLTRVEMGGHGAATKAFNLVWAAVTRAVVVRFDMDRVRDELLAPLATKHFGSAASSEYFVSVARRGSPGDVIFALAPPDSPLDEAHADLTTGMFDLRMNALGRLGAGASNPQPPGAAPHLAITIVRRAADGAASRVMMTGGQEQGKWQVLVRHRTGSLDAVVARSRRRNLGVSLGVLGLLVTSVLLTVASARRQQRLARQQMAFVASVSHELRTPLAVICSAGENLADGVVADGEQVKRYGLLVETEGRRLAGMVERVMEFAGIGPGSPTPAHVQVDVATVIAEAVAAVGSDARDRGVTIRLDAKDDVPPVSGDVGTLRSAVENILGNAVKYSPNGATVDVTAAAHGAGVRIRVADRGLGIDPDDLPHIFKPFFRGRRAVDAQVRGSGIGLSVVRHAVDTHQGAIHVDSRPGEGTTVTVDLPASVPS